MALYLTERDVEALLGPDDALAAVEGSFRRLANGSVENGQRDAVPPSHARLD